MCEGEASRGHRTQYMRSTARPSAEQVSPVMRCSRDGSDASPLAAGTAPLSVSMALTSSTTTAAAAAAFLPRLGLLAERAAHPQQMRA